MNILYVFITTVTEIVEHFFQFVNFYVFLTFFIVYTSLTTKHIFKILGESGSFFQYVVLLPKSYSQNPK